MCAGIAKATCPCTPHARSGSSIEWTLIKDAGHGHPPYPPHARHTEQCETREARPTAGLCFDFPFERWVYGYPPALRFPLVRRASLVLYGSVCRACGGYSGWAVTRIFCLEVHSIEGRFPAAGGFRAVHAQNGEQHSKAQESKRPLRPQGSSIDTCIISFLLPSSSLVLKQPSPFSLPPPLLFVSFWVSHHHAFQALGAGHCVVGHVLAHAHDPLEEGTGPFLELQELGLVPAGGDEHCCVCVWEWVGGWVGDEYTLSSFISLFFRHTIGKTIQERKERERIVDVPLPSGPPHCCPPPSPSCFLRARYSLYRSCMVRPATALLKVGVLSGWVGGWVR